MNEAEHEDLLSDVLAETAPAEFRAALLGEALHRVRRRRRWRQVRRVTAAFAVVALLTVLIWRSVSPPMPGGDRSYRLVRTQPLLASAAVATKPLPAGQLVVSSSAVPVVNTVNPDRVRFLNDEQLLALLAPRPVALVRLGSAAELIFVNPEEEEESPIN